MEPPTGSVFCLMLEMLHATNVLAVEEKTKRQPNEMRVISVSISSCDRQVEFLIAGIHSLLLCSAHSLGFGLYFEVQTIAAGNVTL